MVDSVTDFHNNLLPRGEEKFLTANIASGTTYTASGVMSLTAEGSNVTYLIDKIRWNINCLSGTFPTNITASSSQDPNGEEWVRQWTTWQELVNDSDKADIYYIVQGGLGKMFGEVKLEPLFQMDASAVQNFEVTVTGTPTTDIDLVLRYYKLDTRNV